jgi:hypothetical protein
MRLLAAIVLAWAILVSCARAQEEDAPTVPYAGPHLFCHVLHTNKMTPIESFTEAMKAPMETTIILFGDPAFLKETTWAEIRLTQFLDAGGSLLIATDHEWNLGELSIHFTGTPVYTPEDQSKEFAYRGELECPMLRYAFVDKGHDVRAHPLFGLLHKGIATNYPSHLRVLRGNKALEGLLEFPFADELWIVRPGRRPGLHAQYMAGSPKNTAPLGRALYIAGHGMFINAMMAQTDSDNFEFAGNAVRWLREGPDGTSHSKVLFYVDGEIVSNFDMKLTPPIPPLPIPPVAALNRLVRGWENERFFQNMLAEALGSNMGRFIAIVLGIVTLIVLIYGAKKFMEARHHFETTVPQLLGPQLVAKGTMPSEQRQQALLRHGDFREPSRHLANAWLQQEFGVTPGANARFHAEGFFWWRWRLQRQADFVLRLTRNAGAARMSRPQFFALVKTLKELSAAAKGGRLALLADGKNVRQS